MTHGAGIADSAGGFPGLGLKRYLAAPARHAETDQVGQRQDGDVLLGHRERSRLEERPMYLLDTLREELAGIRLNRGERDKIGAAAKAWADGYKPASPNNDDLCLEYAWRRLAMLEDRLAYARQRDAHLTTIGLSIIAGELAAVRFFGPPAWWFLVLSMVCVIVSLAVCLYGRLADTRPALPEIDQVLDSMLGEEHPKQAMAAILHQVSAKTLPYGRAAMHSSRVATLALAVGLALLVPVALFSAGGAAP